MSRLTVGADGACLNNPGPAGWAWVDEHGNYRVRSTLEGTNNIAELNALLDALQDHRDIDALTIQTDSEYALNGATTWRASWERNGMRNSKKKPIANQDLIRSIWIELDARKNAALIVHVPGHDPENRYPLNTAADILADQAATQEQAGHGADRTGKIDLATVTPRVTSYGRW